MISKVPCDPNHCIIPWFHNLCSPKTQVQWWNLKIIIIISSSIKGESDWKIKASQIIPEKICSDYFMLCIDVLATQWVSSVHWSFYHWSVWICSWGKKFPQENKNFPSCQLLWFKVHVYFISSLRLKKWENIRMGQHFEKHCQPDSKDTPSPLLGFKKRYASAILFNPDTVSRVFRTNVRNTWLPHNMYFLIPHSILLWKNDIIISHIGHWKESMSLCIPANPGRPCLCSALTRSQLATWARYS